MKVLALFLLALFVATASSQTCGDGVCSPNFAENKVNCPADCEDVCPCRRYCEGRECGPDGCGGSCGECPFPRACNDVGRCECDRNCIGKECGDDGCNSGDLCDFCGPFQTCGNDFLCRGECTPNCVNPDGSRRQCGNDGCFGSCGECTPVPGQDIRCRDGRCTCRPQCDMIECGPDGCGGDCGACEGDASCIEGFCVYPTLGCCGDGLCDASANETTCSCPTDCRGCCVDQNCNTLFGETPDNCEDCRTNLVIYINVRNTGERVGEVCTIAVTGPANYAETLTWTPTSLGWTVVDGAYGAYTFVTNCPSYEGESAVHTVTVTTTEITLFVSFRALNIEVRDFQTNALLNTASIRIVGGATSNSYQWVSPLLAWIPFSGYISYEFTTSSTGYLTNVETRQVQISTTLITLYLTRGTVPIIYTDCQSQAVLNGVSVTSSASFNTTYSASFTVSGNNTQFQHIGFGQYFFSATLNGYFAADRTPFNLDQSTTAIRLCLDRQPTCGDGKCNGNETASAGTSNSCYDCGRLRGVISLAVGQKDQLSNITISVWAHPENPAIRMRNNEPVPAPHFTTVSDSKGFFSISKLSFDAPVGPSGTATQNSYSRRFYFSLTGLYTDRTGDNDQQSALLPLWWNYELTNRQWSGSGTLVGTNNSPSLYFYMTPPFTTNDALVRVILSWGTLISTPSSSIPDLDLVVAGPVTSESIAAYGTGVINFSNKDAHSSSNTILPYAKIITDSAQGFGPEVFDFYGAPGSTEFGFSSSYAADAPANAYEVWVDRPNSSPNQDSIQVRIADTNSFIVIYQASTTGNPNDNKQVLFDARTGVEHAYGFYNTDQWNEIPNDASMWHIIDFSLVDQGVKFEGFPDDRSEQPGAKYSYAGGFFDATKTFPCGHVAARGANPAYCPATLTYPQTKK